MDDSELEALLTDLESDRVERKESVSDGDKIRQAICAFANDLPNHRCPGIVFVGADDRGNIVNRPITDQLILTLADMRSDGNIVPFPTMVVQKRTLRGQQVVVVTVEPADAPPVRYKGTAWIRVGSRRAVATVEDERRLAEKRKAKDIPFDLQPVPSAEVDDLDEDQFRRVYLPAALSQEVLDQNERTIEHQLLAMRFITVGRPFYPTVVGMLVVGKTPTDFIPGAYVQFLRLDGIELTDPIKSREEVSGPILELLRRVDDLLRANVSTATDITSGAIEIQRPDYPLAALQQITRNAVMHRTYGATHAPIRINWFSDRIEIQNPGGPFGQVTRDNFGQPGITDYRNPYLAEAMKNLGFVQRFGVGIATARKEMSRNGNPPPEFRIEASHVAVILRRRP